MRNTGLGESQTGIKTTGRNISDLKFADDTSLMAESKEELKNFLMRVKRIVKKAGLKLTFKRLRSWHPVPSFYGKQMGKNWKQ